MLRKEYELFEKGEALEGLRNNSAIVVADIDELVEEAKLLVEQGSRKVTLSVFVTNKSMSINITDLENITLKKIKKPHSGIEAYLIVDGPMKEIVCFKKGHKYEICTDEYENETFFSEWYPDNREVFFSLLDTDVRVINSNNQVRVFMTLDDE